jgi:acetyl esterase/lipase
MLQQAGVPVNYIRYDTMAHGFVTSNRLVKEAEEAIDKIAEEINNRL